jgi:N-acyl-D-amino-acid deacylase
LFDPESIIDNATPEHPSALSTGIRTVWVNGQVVFENGQASGRLPGRFLARSDKDE